MRSMVNRYENVILTLNKFNWFVALEFGAFLLIYGIACFPAMTAWPIIEGILGIACGILGKMKVVGPINEKQFDSIWKMLLIVGIIGCISVGAGALFIAQAILIKVGGKSTTKAPGPESLWNAENTRILSRLWMLVFCIEIGIGSILIPLNSYRLHFTGMQTILFYIFMPAAVVCGLKALYSPGMKGVGWALTSTALWCGCILDFLIYPQYPRNLSEIAFYFPFVIFRIGILYQITRQLQPRKSPE